MVKHLHLKGFVALATAFATSFGAFAATPIHDAAGLAAISNDLAGEYELAADIQLTGEWTSIGTSLAPFEGVFDGKGSRAYGNITIQLTGISRDDFCVEVFGQFYGKGCLARCRRSGDNYKCIVFVGAGHHLRNPSPTRRAISTITACAFSIEGIGTNSYRPWKLRPPAKILGQGKPLNDS